MKGSQASKFAAAINAQLDAARLNHRKPTPDSPDFDPAHVNIDMVTVAQAANLDDEARARLQAAIDSTKQA